MNDSIDTAKDSTHVHTDACQHKHHTRGLPDIQESNIVPLWDEAREWSDSVSVYIEIPLNISGGKLYAHKTMKRKGKKTIFERVRPESMLVFEQRLGKKKDRLLYGYPDRRKRLYEKAREKNENNASYSRRPCFHRSMVQVLSERTHPIGLLLYQWQKNAQNLPGRMPATIRLFERQRLPFHQSGRPFLISFQLFYRLGK